LLCKCKALSSNPNPAKKKKKKRQNVHLMHKVSKELSKLGASGSHRGRDQEDHSSKSAPGK
jgi:hypothetical protein